MRATIAERGSLNRDPLHLALRFGFLRQANRQHSVLEGRFHFLRINILANGDFSNGLVSWNTYFSAPAAGTIANENGSARAAIANPGVNEYDIQLWQGAPLTAGRGYTLDFDVKGEATPKNFKIVVEHNGSPWTKYVDLAKTVTSAANAYQHYTVAWTQGVDDAGGRVLFDFGAQNESDLWVDNVVLK